MHLSSQRFLTQAADAAAARWTKQDQGILEVRGAPRDVLYSKLMCWAALDCALGLVGQLGAIEQAATWTAAPSEIRQAILTYGWSERSSRYDPVAAALKGDAFDA